LTFKDELLPILLKPHHKIEREGTLPCSLYEASTIFIPKLVKDKTKDL
jgi:hypothetical protein